MVNDERMLILIMLGIVILFAVSNGSLSTHPRKGIQLLNVMTGGKKKVKMCLSAASTTIEGAHSILL